MELDLKPVLLRELRIPLKAVLRDPLLEGLSNEGEDDVADVLPRHLADLPHDGEALHDCPEGEAEVEDAVQRQALVLGNGDVSDVVAEDGLWKMKMRKDNLPSYHRWRGPSCARW